MADGGEVVQVIFESLETQVKRLAALVAAARDMASVVVSTDQSLVHAQELLAIADEISPGLIAELSAAYALLKSHRQDVVIPPRAA